MTETGGPNEEAGVAEGAGLAAETAALAEKAAVMAPLAQAPARRGSGLLGALAGFALIAGLFLWLAPPPPAKQSEPEPSVAPATTPPPVATPEATPPAPPPPPPPAPLRFDTVRVEPSGAAAVAGAAPDRARLILRLDGVPVAEGEASANGDFALLFDLPPSVAVQILTLEAELPDGTRRASAEQIALAPRQVAAPAVGQPPPPLVLGTEGPRPATAPPAPSAGGAPGVALDLIAQERGRLTVAGQSVGGAALRLYLDDAPAREMALAVPGPWRLALPPATEGAHRLRADLLDAAGKVIARAEQSFTQLPEPAVPGPEPVLAPPVPSSPSATPPSPEPAPPVPLPASALPPPPEPAPPVITLRVEKGFTLWQIAAEQLGDPYLYVQIFAENRDQIRDPDLIYPGQVFTLPPTP